MKNQQDQQIVSSLLIFVIVVMLVFAITGCSTAVPVTAKFPEAPKVLLDKCPPLQTIDKQENVSIIDITKNVTANYTTYYECGTKVENWIEWYNEQQKLWKTLK
jgi:hypothetical protein